MPSSNLIKHGPEFLPETKRWMARNRALTRTAIHSFYRSHKGEWGLGTSVTAGEFLNYLEQEGVVIRVQVNSEGSYSPITRFITANASPFDLALSLKAKSFLSHSTAVFVHGLTDRLPRTIYVNAEQSPKPKPAGRLTQGSLDRAFRSKQRTSRFVFLYEGRRIVILSGKNTGRRGVVEMAIQDNGAPSAVSDLERTLVEIAVRPAYGGGVQEVFKAYQTAAPTCSISKLLATLKHFDYVYPYHQAIGFYLDRAGVASKHVERFQKLGTEFNFYLAYGMKDPEYDSKWRIFHPKGF